MVVEGEGIVLVLITLFLIKFYLIPVVYHSLFLFCLIYVDLSHVFVFVSSFVFLFYLFYFLFFLILVAQFILPFFIIRDKVFHHLSPFQVILSFPLHYSFFKLYSLYLYEYFLHSLVSLSFQHYFSFFLFLSFLSFPHSNDNSFFLSSSSIYLSLILLSLSLIPIPDSSTFYLFLIIIFHCLLFIPFLSPFLIFP